MINKISYKMKIKNWLEITTVAAFPICGWASSDLSMSEKPNIIYILADDLGRAELGCYGQRLIETPNIDKLAKNGLLFTDHYSGQAVSGPSRCCLFTGFHPGHSYIRGNDEMEDRGNVWSFSAMNADSTLEGQRPLPADAITVGHKLQEGGYVTACVGKWGLGFPGSVSTPCKMGFDFFYGYNCQRQAHTYYPLFLYRNEVREYLDNEPVAPHTQLDKGADPRDAASYRKYNLKMYAPDLMFDEIIKFVEKQQQPFALFWTTPIPHVPLQAPQRWVDYYRAKFGDEKPYEGSSGYFPCLYPRATYAAMVSYLDEQVGQLVQKLKELDLYENTLIIFTSDNGPSFNGGTDSQFFDSAAPYKSDYGWGKCSLREGGIRVPMIASWPRHIRKGTTTELLSAFWDIMPTFCDIAGVETPATDGISILPTLLGKKKQKKHPYLYWEFSSDFGGQKAVRMGKWKAYVANVLKGNRQIALYNLEKDPGEQQDVAAQYPKVVSQILQIFRDEHENPEFEQFNLPVW